MQRARAYNFSPGPATLPLEVLENLSRYSTEYKSIGAAMFEISHRSPEFIVWMRQLLLDLRLLSGAPDHFSCFVLSGGASLQFSGIPLNFLHNPKKHALYLNTGHWSQSASQEAKRMFPDQVHIVDEEEFQSVDPDDYDYFHYCNNESISGLRTHIERGNRQIIDATSCILTEPIDWSKAGLVYASSQKQLGVAGATLVWIRDDFLDQCSPSPFLPTNLNYQRHKETESNPATPPVMTMFMLRLVLDWIQKKGVLALQKSLQNRAQALYAMLESNPFYRLTIQEASRRSTLNVSFKTPSAKQDELLWNSADREGLMHLKGHRALGGLRASLYIGLPDQAVQSLIAYLERFAKEQKG